MILVNGRQTDQMSEELILELTSTICYTLSQPVLAKEDVIKAMETMITNVISGKYEKELQYYAIDPIQINKLQSSLEHHMLEEKYELELGQWKRNIETSGTRKVRPLGVLLHIAAGNMDVLPIYSLLEGLLAGNINLLKLPSMDRGLTIFLARELLLVEPRLIPYVHIFDTPSSDLTTIRQLMELANGIAIWGGDQAVKALRKQAPVNVKLIEWGHKLSFCYFDELNVPRQQLELLAVHLLRTNQLLCSSYQVIYLNTEDFSKVKAFGERFATILREKEVEYPLEKAVQGKIMVELKTRKLENILYGSDEEYRIVNHRTSVCCKADSFLELSLLYGNVLIKPLPEKKIIQTLYPNKSHLQTVAVYPKNEHTVSLFLRTGVTHITQIEEAFELVGKASHDGVFALQQYSRIIEV